MQRWFAVQCSSVPNAYLADLNFNFSGLSAEVTHIDLMTDAT